MLVMLCLVFMLAYKKECNDYDALEKLYEAKIEELLETQRIENNKLKLKIKELNVINLKQLVILQRIKAQVTEPMSCHDE